MHKWRIIQELFLQWFPAYVTMVLASMNDSVLLDELAQLAITVPQTVSAVQSALATDLTNLLNIHWLSWLLAVNAAAKSYEALVLYFDDQANKDVTAEGI